MTGGVYLTLLGKGKPVPNEAFNARARGSGYSMGVHSEQY